MTVKRSENPYDLCTFTYADGRICGNPSTPSGDGKCRSHASLRRLRPIVDDELTADLPNFTADIPSQEEIHRTITRVIQALAANRISTRRAATFGYLAQLLLTTRPNEKTSPSLQSSYKFLAKLVDENCTASNLDSSRSASSLLDPSSTPKST
jgi:hypothetical protein